MGRENRDKKLRLKLNAAEADFRELLRASLRKCRDGSRGVFLTEAEANRMGDVYPQLVWLEAKQLDSFGKEVASLRQQLGEPMEESLYARYQQYWARTGPNDPGGAKLAAEFLAEIDDKLAKSLGYTTNEGPRRH
jgi:hypothetical protein